MTSSPTEIDNSQGAQDAVDRLVDVALAFARREYSKRLDPQQFEGNTGLLELAHSLNILGEYLGAAESDRLGLDAIVDVALAFARREFDSRVDLEPFTNQPALLELALTLNLLGEYLGETTVSKAYVEKIIDAVADLLIVVSADGEIRTVNQATVKALGYDAAELTDRPIDTLLVPGAHGEPTFADTLGRSLSEGGTLRDAKATLVAKAGTRLPVVFNGAVMPGSGTEGEAIVLVGRDMRETHRLLAAAAASEQAERRKAEQLAVTITQLERSQRETAAAARLAQAANEAKSNFLANMSHEIRTPMNGIFGMLTLLELSQLDEEQRECTELIQFSAKQLMHVINDILDFSKIETGKLELEEINFDIRADVGRVIDVYSADSCKAQIALHCIVDPAVPSDLIGDPGRLAQILNNLLGNAIKFTPQGSVSLEVSVEETNDTTSRLRFAVRDTGIGISQALVPELFSPFTQVDASVTRKYGGTGLGLAISKELAELLGGEIGVESEEGVGATFWFTAIFRNRPAA